MPFKRDHFVENINKGNVSLHTLLSSHWYAKTKASIAVFFLLSHPFDIDFELKARTYCIKG